MRVYLGKQRNVTSTDVTPTHGTVLELAQEVEGVGWCNCVCPLSPFYATRWEQLVTASSAGRHL
jgi:hypothetical protein